MFLCAQLHPFECATRKWYVQMSFPHVCNLLFSVRKMVEEGDTGGSGGEVIFFGAQRLEQAWSNICVLFHSIDFGSAFVPCRGMYQSIIGGTRKELLSDPSHFRCSWWWWGSRGRDFSTSLIVFCTWRQCTITTLSIRKKPSVFICYILLFCFSWWFFVCVMLL